MKNFFGKMFDTEFSDGYSTASRRVRSSIRFPAIVQQIGRLVATTHRTLFGTSPKACDFAFRTAGFADPQEPNKVNTELWN